MKHGLFTMVSSLAGVINSFNALNGLRATVPQIASGEGIPEFYRNCAEAFVHIHEQKVHLRWEEEAQDRGPHHHEDHDAVEQVEEARARP